MAVTRATSTPLVREVDGGALGPLVVSVTARGLEVRPKRARRAHRYSGTAPWEEVYLQLVAEQLGHRGLLERQKRREKAAT